MVNIKLVDSKNIDLHWQDAAPHIRRATERAPYGHSLTDIREKLESGDMQLWLLGDVGAAVTQVHQMPRSRRCLIYLLGGDEINSWVDLFLHRVETWAKSLGCEVIEIAGRRGWEKMGITRGFEYAYTVIRKDLKHV